MLETAGDPNATPARDPDNWTKPARQEHKGFKLIPKLYVRFPSHIRLQLHPNARAKVGHKGKRRHGGNLDHKSGRTCHGRRQLAPLTCKLARTGGVCESAALAAVSTFSGDEADKRYSDRQVTGRNPPLEVRTTSALFSPGASLFSFVKKKLIGNTRSRGSEVLSGDTSSHVTKEGPSRQASHTNGKARRKSRARRAPPRMRSSSLKDTAKDSVSAMTPLEGKNYPAGPECRHGHSVEPGKMVWCDAIHCALGSQKKWHRNGVWKQADSGRSATWPEAL